MLCLLRCTAEREGPEPSGRETYVGNTEKCTHRKRGVSTEWPSPCVSCHAYPTRISDVDDAPARFLAIYLDCADIDSGCVECT